MTIRLRAATAQDAPALRVLEDAIFPEDPWSDGMIAEELAAKWRFYVLAEHIDEQGQATPVGYGGVSLGPDADIMTVGVLADFRGTGLGTRVVESLLNAAQAAGSERIFLEVRESNMAAQRLYEKHGFERIGRVRGYFRHPLEDAVTMRFDVLSESGVS